MTIQQATAEAGTLLPVAVLALALAVYAAGCALQEMWHPTGGKR
jgi:hypothetical protein